MRLRKRAEDQDVVRITDAPLNVAQDVSARQRRYLLSMGIRTACFIGAVVSYSAGLTWLCWVLIVASLFLPFIAVVIANAASPRLPENVTGPGFDAGPGYKELD